MNKEQRNLMIEEYGRGFDLLATALTEIPRELWDFKPAPVEWSVREVLGHMADSEMMGVIRLRKLISEPGDTLMMYNESQWAEALNYQEQDADDALLLFQLLRRTTYRLLKGLPDQAFTYSLIHPLWDEPYTIEKWLVLYTEHVPEHIEQIKNTFQAWKQQHENLNISP